MREIDYWLLILLCFSLSAVFSAAETALTSLSPVAAERMASGGNWFERGLKYWIQFPNRLLAAVLVGNTIVNTVVAMIVGYYFSNRHPEISPVLVTTGLTLMILVFGEVAPKMIARSYAEGISPLASRLLILVNYLVYPITSAISTGLSLALGTFGFITQRKTYIKPQDIEHMVIMAGRQGSIERDKTKILSSVFEFSKRRVREIMIPRDRISAISVDAPLVEVLERVRNENHSRYPVFNQSLDRIVGFFHSRDLFGILKSYGYPNPDPTVIEGFSLRTCLRRAFFVSEQALISRVLNDMKSNRIHLAIVKDEWGNVVGLVTLEDILEEVFGEIEDEHDEQTVPPVIDMYATGVELDGDSSLLDLKEKYGIELESSDSYTTLNGFLQHYAVHQQLTPKTVIIWNNYVFSILAIRAGAIERVRITEIPQENE